MDHYKRIPIFIQVGQFTDQTVSPTAVIMEAKDAQDGNLVNQIISSCFELHENLYLSFNKYDTKRHGKIALKNLAPVLHEAGVNLSDEYIKKGSKQLDINCDGRILYEQLRSWIFSGHTLRTGMVGSIIDHKATFMRKAREIQPVVNKILNTMQQEQL